MSAVAQAEYRQRRERARAAAGARGLDALLVCARGGGALDRYGDVLYLTGFYSSFPFIPDQPGQWSGRAHPYLLLPVNGNPVLVADLPYLDGVALDRGDVRITDHVLDTLAEAIRDADLAGGRIGLAGSDTMPVAHHQALTAALPALRLEPADEVVARLRAVKSEAEIDCLRRSARLGSRTVEAMLDAAEAGARHGDVVAAGLQALVPEGGVLYNCFMASGTGGPDPSVVRSRFPTWADPTPLEPGQWLRLGISGVVDGYVFDVSRSKAIGAATNRQIDAFEAAIAVVEAGLEACRPGARAGDVARAALAVQAERGYPVQGVFSGLGHGIGLGWDLPWLTPDDPTALEPGMVINVERTLTADGYLGDFEDTVLVTADGPVLLTDARKRSW